MTTPSLALSRVLGFAPAVVQAADIRSLQRAFGNQIVQRLLANAAQPRLLGRVQPGVIQRAITIQNIDYIPDDDEYRHGFIDDNALFAGLRNTLNAAPFADGHKNNRINVLNAVAQQDFNQPDIPSATTAIVAAIREQYRLLGMPIAAGNMRTALETAVHDRLVANIRQDNQHGMDNTETAAFDQLGQAQGVVRSRAKGTANQIDYARLPQAVSAEVTARLTEIRNERARWNVAALGNQYTLPNREFAAEVMTRLRPRYQGNHTNNAGWLPQVNVPVDAVTQVANTIRNGAGGALQAVLDAPDAMTLLAQGTPEGNAMRREYRTLREQHMVGLTDDGVRNAAMLAVCQGVSAYIEFSMGGGISRLVYDAVNSRVYVTAHYKWREGYNPFFQVNNFPAV